MRDIRFRAWHPGLKRMFYDCRVSSGDWLDNSTHFSGEHDTLMQFTGLLDKNGKEIYEGDRDKDGGTVMWNEDHAAFVVDYPGEEMQDMEGASDWFEIASNIYENPIATPKEATNG